MDFCNACGLACGGSIEFDVLFGRPYHRHCIKCGECRGNIMGNVWKSPETGGLRCDDCHQRNKPICTGCGHQILDESILQYLGQPYHSDCFRCTLCRAPIEGDIFHTNPLRCKGCWRSQQAPCAKCHGPIEDGRIKEFDNQFYHPACFTCTLCSRPITGQLVKDNGLFCVDWGCADRYQQIAPWSARYQPQKLPTCAKCNGAIEGSSKEFHNLSYHSSCFTCDFCARPIEGRLVNQNGLLLCVKWGCSERYAQVQLGRQSPRDPVHDAGHVRQSPREPFHDSGLQAAHDHEFKNALRTPGGRPGDTIRQAFQQFDKDGNGIISMAELRAVLTRLPVPKGEMPFSDIDFQQFMGIIDENNDGVIDYHEFSDWLAHDGVGADEVMKRMKTPKAGARGIQPGFHVGGQRPSPRPASAPRAAARSVSPRPNLPITKRSPSTEPDRRIPSPRAPNGDLIQFSGSQATRPTTSPGFNTTYSSSYTAPKFHASGHNHR